MQENKHKEQILKSNNLLFIEKHPNKLQINMQNWKKMNKLYDARNDDVKCFLKNWKVRRMEVSRLIQESSDSNEKKKKKKHLLLTNN